MIFFDETLKNKWKDFFETAYKSEIETTAINHKKNIYLDYQTLDRYNPQLAEELINNPEQNIQHAEKAITEIDTAVGKITPKLRIKNLPAICKTKISDITASHINKLVSIDGLVNRVTPFRVKYITAAFRCQKCGAIIYIPQKKNQYLTEPAECYKDQGGCGRKTSFEIIDNLSQLEGYQKVQLLEKLENTPPAQQPEKLTVELLGDDLTRQMLPGDIVRINGILYPAKKYKNATLLTQKELILEAYGLELEKTIQETIHITEEDKQKIIETSKDPLLYEKMLASIAPNLTGLYTEKKAILLQALGGVEQNPGTPGRERGDIHILLIGDPGMGKSQLLRFAAELQPRSFFCDGTGSTAAGLTATAVKSSFADGEWTLAAGALVLADGGIAIIDELDKMNKEDRQSLHIAMEQQEIGIAKAGLTAKFKTRCAVLSAANPIEGRFDRYRLIPEQFDLPVTLLSRFDLIFPTIDTGNTEKDEITVNKMFTTQQTQENTTEQYTYPLEFLKKYIAYAKQLKPIATEEAKQLITNYYITLRKQALNSLAVTPRQAHSLRRLAEANAKLRLSPKIEKQDAEQAIRLYDIFLERVCTDMETGNIDMGILYLGKTHSQQERMNILLNILREKDRTYEYTGVPKIEIIEAANRMGISPEKTEAALEKLKKEGKLYTPSFDKYRVVE